MCGKRQVELRAAWESLAENVKAQRVLEWDRRRLLRMAWREMREGCERSRQEAAEERGDEGEEEAAAAEQVRWIMGNFLRQKIGDRLAALEGMKRASFLKWQALLSVREGRRRSDEVEDSYKVRCLVKIM